MSVYKFYSSVADTGVACGTGSVTALGVVPTGGYNSIPATFANNDHVYIRLADSLSASTVWEDFQTVYTTSSSSLTRGTVMASSNTGARINFTNAVNIYHIVDAEWLNSPYIPTILGDITGTNLATSVVAIQGHAVNAASLSANGQYLGLSADNTTIIGRDPYMPMFNTPVAGRDYMRPTLGSALIGTQANTGLSAITYQIILPPNCQTLTGIAIYSAGLSAGCSAWVAVYNDAGNNTPGALLVDGGQIAIGSTNARLVASVSASLTAQKYWVWINLNKNVILRCYALNGSPINDNDGMTQALVNANGSTVYFGGVSAQAFSAPASNYGTFTMQPPTLLGQPNANIPVISLCF